MRAKNIAETMLEDVFCYNQVRVRLDFSGRYGNEKISVMGTGMGIPTLSVYVHELVSEYHVKTLIRVGICGSLQSHIKIGDVVLPVSCSTDSHIYRLRFEGMDYASTDSFHLLLKAYEVDKEIGARVHVGGMSASDAFYNDDPEWWKKWAEYGALVVEMVTPGLYTLATQFNAHALSVLTCKRQLGDWRNLNRRAA